jgi:hypothetical protein
LLHCDDGQCGAPSVVGHAALPHPVEDGSCPMMPEPHRCCLMRSNRGTRFGRNGRLGDRDGWDATDARRVRFCGVQPAGWGQRRRGVDGGWRRERTVASSCVSWFRRLPVSLFAGLCEWP